MDFIRWAISPTPPSKRSSLDMYELCDVVRQELSADIPGEPCYGWLPSLELCHQRPARREPVPFADSEYHADDELSIPMSQSVARTGYVFDTYASSIARSPVRTSHQPSTHPVLSRPGNGACPDNIESIFKTLHECPVAAADKAEAITAWTSTIRSTMSGSDSASIEIIRSPVVEPFAKATRTEVQCNDGPLIDTNDDAFEIPAWMHNLSMSNLQTLSLDQENMQSEMQSIPELREYTPERIRQMIAVLTARSRSISQLRAFWEGQR
jgi:hypothetical protein